MKAGLFYCTDDQHLSTIDKKVVDMRIVIGSDHRGWQLKEFLKESLTDIEWIDVGTSTRERTDYPIYSHLAIHRMRELHISAAVLLCGSGAGMAIAANRHPGIYAAVVWNEQVATSVKEDDNCNVLVLPADYVSLETSTLIVQAWLQATFKQHEYQRRLELVDAE